MISIINYNLKRMVRTAWFPLTSSNCLRLLPTGVVLAAAMSIAAPNVAADEVTLGSAANYAVLAGSTITSTGSTIINGGNVGVSPGTAITGFPPAVITPPYTADAADTAALNAQYDLLIASGVAAGLVPNQILTGQDLGGMTLTPGVYHFDSSAQLTGTLTLNNEGNPDAVFVFQIGSTLTTASNSLVVSINDPSMPGNTIFWQVGTSATLGTGATFEGNILASTSITANSGGAIDGRLLAETGAVTLDDTTLWTPPAEVQGSGGSPVPDHGSTLLLLSLGLVAVFAFGHRAHLGHRMGLG